MTGMAHGSNVAIALVHHPVYNKNHDVVATAVTNLDVHDIARAARTFGLCRYYVVTPVPGQQELVSRITNHWREGWGAGYNPKRKAAIDLLKVVPTLEDASADLAALHGARPLTVVTGAAARDNSISFPALADRISDSSSSWLLVLGTGWGLTENLFDAADYVLEPIQGAGDYNHLSVRAAAAIILDRLLGR